MFKLMIKTHNKTGLKYLCITKKDDYKNYKGSGSNWKKHLKENGSDINTKLLYVSSDYEMFLQKCIYYSKLYDVANNNEFANITPEYGYGYRNNLPKLNENDYCEYIDNLNKCHPSNKDEWEDIKRRIGKSNKKQWKNLSKEEIDKKLEPLRIGLMNFINNKSSKSYKDWCDNLKKSSIEFWDKAKKDEEYMKKRGEISKQTRLNLSEDKKLARKIKIQKVYATGKHDELFKRYSEERKGKGNPMAKLIEYENKIYSMNELLDFLGISVYNLNKQMDQYTEKFKKIGDNWSANEHIDDLICPYCNKIGSSTNTGFLRWHMENCKYKEK